MIRNLIWNDIKQNKLSSAATVFFMGVSAMLLALTVLLASGLLGAIDGLMEKAEVPDYIQMNAGDIDLSEIARFAESREEVEEWQVCRFLNLDNSRITLGGQSLADSTQDNGLCVQGERFDYLLNLENETPEVLKGEVYVPVCYRTRYHLSVGDMMGIGDNRLQIAGFIRDAQMNSMMASSKRFLVNAADYEEIKAKGEEEYLIEFLLHDGAEVNRFSTAYAAEELPVNGPAITRPLIRMMNALSDGTMIFVIFLLSIIILLISMLCIRFMLLLQVERDRKEIGMLKALGVGKEEVRRIYFAKYILFSGCGALAGLLAAFFLKNPLAKQMRELYGGSDSGVQSFVLAVLAVCFIEGMILFSVGHSLKKIEKLSALEALFDLPEKKSSKGIRRTGRGQSFLIGFVSAACALLVIVPQNLYSTMSAPEFVTYMGIGNSEIRMDVRQRESIDAATEQIASALEQDTRVRQYAVLRTKSCPAVLADGKTVHLTIETGDHNIFPVSCSEGALPRSQTEIALSSINAEELALSVGDTLQLMVEGKRVDYTVCGIYSDITNGGKTAKAYSVGDGSPTVWSVLYVSLSESADREAWMKQYGQMGADVTDLADYVKDTYGQTLGQLRLACGAAMAVAGLVIFVVVMLFMRLIVEKDRYTISLHKALGFTGSDIKKDYFGKGLFPVSAGIISGIVSGNLFGERLCGLILKSFGADSFRFVISWERIAGLIPVVLLGPAVLAILAGIRKIGQIKAYECCMGKE